MLSDHVIDEFEHARWFESIRTDDTKKYWVIMKDDQPVGCANLTRIDLNRSSCDWALYVAEPEIRGKGTGQAAGFLMERFVFDDLGLERLSCEVLGSNESFACDARVLGLSS
jgi:UDP-4-amino-4,6-dideoxy-N-acetyl-beta-L-altrosamine N-acetyltransferase